MSHIRPYMLRHESQVDIEHLPVIPPDMAETKNVWIIC
jgi:hypothetical protein